LLEIFCKEVTQYGFEVRTQTVAEAVTWREGHVQISVRNSTGSADLLEAPIVLVTLPLSLLQQGVIAFTPQLPVEELAALDKLEMGKVIRVSLCFRERFWEAIKPPRAGTKLCNMSFLFSQDAWFPTWWTTMPRKSPILTGWAPFRSAERLSGQSDSFVVERSLQTLSALLKISVKELESLLASAHFHDWQSDPFSRGAYSYGKVGGDGAQQILARPLMNTLFFAGEATDTTGHNGTVHGAIASGHRAAKQILQTLGNAKPIAV
jgi:monoamine oxidase